MMLAWLALPLLSAVPGYVPELRRVVVYEANFRALGPHPGFKALTDRLPAIRKLGVNVLWLMPVQPVGKVKSAGGLGSPYALSDFVAVNPEFGTSQDLRGLIQSAHKLKMAVILDWVADHTSWDSVWIAAHPDWYQHDQKGQICSPPGTGWNDVAALDYRNPAMRAQMITAMDYWVSNYGFDGFRCDSADRMPADFWKKAITSVKAIAGKPIFMLAEGWKADSYAAGFDLTYGWDFCTRLRQVYGGKSATEVAAAASNEAKEIPAGARRLRFATNHDLAAFDGSLIEFYKTPEGVRTAFALTALYGGTPLIYTGQEVGWSKRIPIFDDSSIDWNAGVEDAKFIADVIHLREEHPAFRDGDCVDRSIRDAVVFSRRAGSDEGLVVANVRDREISAPISSGLRGEWKDGTNGSPRSLGATVTLPAFTSLILVRTHP